MKIEELGSRLGFELKENIYTFTKNGYVIYLKDWEYLILNIPSFYIPVKTIINKDFVKKLEQAALNNACAYEKLSEDKVLLIVSLPDGKKNEEKWKENTDLILNRVIKLLELEDIKPLDRCPICNEEGESHSFMKNYIPMHRNCHQNYYIKVKEIVEKEKKSKKSIILLILSFLFAFIGLIPAILLAYFSYGYFSPLVVLSVLGVALAAFLVKGTHEKWVKYFCASFPIIFVLIFNVFSIPYMAKGNEMDLASYFFSGSFEGLRKVIFTTLLSFGGFGSLKILGKMLDKTKIFKFLEEDSFFNGKES